MTSVEGHIKMRKRRVSLLTSAVATLKGDPGRKLCRFCAACVLEKDFRGGFWLLLLILQRVTSKLSLWVKRKTQQRQNYLTTFRRICAQKVRWSLPPKGEGWEENSEGEIVESLQGWSGEALGWSKISTSNIERQHRTLNGDKARRKVAKASHSVSSLAETKSVDQRLDTVNGRNTVNGMSPDTKQLSVCRNKPVWCQRGGLLLCPKTST